MNVDPSQVFASFVDVTAREVPLTDEGLRECRDGSDPPNLLSAVFLVELAGRLDAV